MDRSVLRVRPAYQCDIIFSFVQFVECFVELDGNLGSGLNIIPTIIGTTILWVLQLLTLGK